ncbi:MAG: hypothetical protein II336_18185 [Loktanella sp.]|nr:hypothetical protein [Loktanella sp.]
MTRRVIRLLGFRAKRVLVTDENGNILTDENGTPYFTLVRLNYGET